MWPFGRKREPADETRCASCGRTLLAGEWTQRMIEDDGSEVLVCSLCSQSRSGRTANDEAALAGGDPRLPSNGRETKRRSDAFWLALKEKDAEIEDLHARLAQAAAEKQALLAELAALRHEDGATSEAASGPEAAAARDEALEVDAAAVLEPASELDAAAAHDLATTDAESLASQAQLEGAGVPASVGGDAGGEIAEDRLEPEPPAVGEARAGELEDTLPGTLSAEELAAGAVVADNVAAAGEGARAGLMETDTADDYLTEEELHLVQRGVDILNVSPVPKKIAETSESLGVPFVHVAIEPDASTTVTYVWPLGWYRFSVLAEGSGSVSLVERGYEELAELQPNGTVRSDGTVQLSPTFGKRPTPKEETAADVEPSVSTASVTSGVIISKSLMGQRTDDEAVVPWEKQNARDFDWGR
jgi:hypothetical protein